MKSTVWGVLGDDIVDQRSFNDAPKLGAALIYVRNLAKVSESDLAKYFGQNTAVIPDTENRARIVAANIAWPTDEQYVKGFYEMNPREGLAERYGIQDLDWEHGAATGMRWLIARAIVHSGSDAQEVLCWLPSHRAEGDPQVLQRLRAFLRDRALIPVDPLWELFTAHDLLPHSGMIMFQIDRELPDDLELYAQQALFVAGDRTTADED